MPPERPMTLHRIREVWCRTRLELVDDLMLNVYINVSFISDIIYIIALMHFPFRQHFFRAIFAEVRSSEGHVLSQVISQLKI